MLTLALDTSGPACSAGLFKSDTATPIGIKSEIIERGHAERLVTQVADLMIMAQCEFSDLSRIGFVAGPGSFAGLRVGLAAAIGYQIACAENAIEPDIVGIGSFEVFRHQALSAHMQQDAERADNLVIFIDGRRGTVFYQTPDLALHTCALADLSSRLPPETIFAGPFAQEAANVCTAEATHIHPMERSPDIASVGALTCNATVESHPAKLIYLRGADAKPGAGFQIERQ